MKFEAQLPIFSGCAVITTYRCNAHCSMCSRWQHQSNAMNEMEPSILYKLPNLHFINITGGEPFLRDDIEEFVRIAHSKANRVVISTNGIIKDRIIEVMRKYPKTGLRISLEGLKKTNDEIRGIPNGYDNAMSLLHKLKKMGCKDIGISITIHEGNCDDVLPLYEICRQEGYEFATGTLHSSFFFESSEPVHFENPDKVCKVIEELSNRMKKKGTIKEKYRAIFNEELIKYIKNEPIAFPCKCGSHFFAIDPYGEMLACVGSEKPIVMGDLSKKSFENIWYGMEASEVRKQVENCKRNCCMSGHVAGEMKRQAIPLANRIIL